MTASPTLAARAPQPSLGRAAGPVSLRSVALPVEHGGWGFVIEPLVVGLVVAPSRAGAALALVALAGFLGRHPLKLVLADRLRDRTYPRTRAAARFVLLYGALALTGLGVALASANDPFYAPLLMALPLALVQLHYDVRLRGRELAPELLGASAPGAMASAMALARGWSGGSALALWMILAARAVVSVLYVRARLRLDRGQPHDPAGAWAGHLLALLLVTALAATGGVPWWAAFVFAVLLVRAIHGLSPRRRVVRPQTLGFQELGLGLLAALLVALGYATTP